MCSTVYTSFRQEECRQGNTQRLKGCIASLLVLHYYVSPHPLGPPTVQSVMSLLWGVAGRWKEIAEGLEFDEDLIDEIDTNNDMDEACLQHCVEMWVFKLQPSWEKLSHALRDLGEEELARQAGNKGIAKFLLIVKM